MEEQRIISGTSEDEIWLQVEAGMSDASLLEYETVIEQGGHRVRINIDIDPGGGFEGGYELTTITAALMNERDFRFAIHHESFLDEIGKFLGMQDVEIGYPEFDKQLIVKTNNEQLAKYIFADENTRRTFQALTDFSFGITHHRSGDEGEKVPFLELEIDRGITDSTELRQLYHAFFSVLTKLADTAPGIVSAS
jgi:hypothetical protein